MSSERRGILFIVSAPSGAGKTTLVERLVERASGLRKSRSYTSRPARHGEIDNVDYNFITRTCFEGMIESGKFLEWADVFGNYYGTGSADTEAVLAAGEDLVLVIDVQGARKVRRLDRDTVAIFVLPPSSVVLESRLRGRNQDDEDQIVARLDLARDEVGEFSAYEYVVINEDVDLTVDRLRAIVVAERARVTHMRDEASGIIKTFRREE